MESQVLGARRDTQATRRKASLTNLLSTSKEIREELEGPQNAQKITRKRTIVYSEALKLCKQGDLRVYKGISTHEDYLRCAWKRW